MATTMLAGPPTIPTQGFDLESLGYLDEEIRFDGTARSFEVTGARTADGRWHVRDAATAPFTTRMVVRRPADPDRFSGTLVVEWLNVSAGMDAAPDWALLHRHLIRRGHAWVGVSAQKAGIDGGGLVQGLHLKKVQPERYGELSHPGDAWSFDIFSQAGSLARREVGARRLLAAGESQSAFYLVTYVNAVDPVDQVFDGFFVHGRGARGAPLDGSGIAGATGSPERIRDDVRVPVLALQSETDVMALGSVGTAQRDGHHLREWEIAGAAHADTYVLVAADLDDGRLSPERLAELMAPTTELAYGVALSPINAGPQQHYVGQAAFDWLDRWAGGGPPPPSAPRLDRRGDGDGFALDAHGIVTGGVRSPWVDVPTATLSGLGQKGEGFTFLFGTTALWGTDALAERYPGGMPQYLEEFSAALDRAIEGGFVLGDDRAEILALAAASFPLPRA
jgi:hypothetical protein